MTRIPPVPSSRIPGLLARQRLTQQYQTDQVDLFRLQEQISTGLRITLPSQDAPAALRAISFQTLLNRKEQLGANINSGLLFLGSTDATLGGADGVSGVLSQIKADTLGVVGTVATDQQREAAIADINGALESLVTLGNRKFNGRYLFSGSQTDVVPYSFENGVVRYDGDHREIQNYSEIGVLFSSSISGQEVFGGISAAVEGDVDLNPQATADTLLSSLRGGRGINSNGSLQIGDATTDELSIVDISSATTLGDVARLIEDNPPAGSTVKVTITGDGLQVSIPGGDLQISEVGTGTTARELGLLADQDQTPLDADTVTSEDLDPQLLKTTRLDSLLGSKAQVRLESTGENNDILLRAKQNGAAFNGVNVEVLDGGDIGGTANIVFNGGTNTLEIYVDDTGETTANHVIDAINADGSLDFVASVDVGDSVSGAEAGTGAVPIGVFPDQTSGGSGTTLDVNSGIRVVNGGETFDFEFSADETVEDLLDRLNQAGTGLEAKINDAGRGLVIRSRLNGGDFQIGELNGGTTATQLGIRTYGTDSQLSDFNFGVGVPTAAAIETTISLVDLGITTSDGSQFNVDLTTATDVNDAINLINTDLANDDGGGGLLVTAQLNAAGNGIELIDNTGGPDELTVVQDGDPIAVADGIDLTIPSIDFNVTAADGTTLAINVSGAESVGDVLDLINNHPDNDDGGGGQLVVAQLATTGNGIELVDLSGGAGSLSVSKVGSSQAAEYLGLLAKGETSTSSTSGTLTGADRNSVENDSVFNSLIRLRDALADNDVPAIERAAALLEDDIDRVTFAQADVGTRFKNLELARFNLEDEEIQVRAALSEEIDVDLVQAISDLTARQISLEASLRATANILQLSLLNFI